MSSVPEPLHAEEYLRSRARRGYEERVLPRDGIFAMAARKAEPNAHCDNLTVVLGHAWDGLPVLPRICGTNVRPVCIPTLMRTIVCGEPHLEDRKTRC